MLFLICIFLFQIIPQFPLPTHDLVHRGNIVKEFQVNWYISTFQFVLANSHIYL